MWSRREPEFFVENYVVSSVVLEYWYSQTTNFIPLSAPSPLTPALTESDPLKIFPVFSQ